MMKAIILLGLAAFVWATGDTMTEEIVTTTPPFDLCSFNCSESHCSDSAFKDIDDCISGALECESCYDYYFRNGTGFSVWVGCYSELIYYYPVVACEGDYSYTADFETCAILEDDVAFGFGNCTASPVVDSTSPSTSRQSLVIIVTGLLLILLLGALVWISGLRL